jgi:general secretion pathway protein D
MDNQSSRIEVTKALPIFKVTTGGTQSGPTVDITYTNIGVILTVTPRISANSNIAMKISPEVSTVDEKRDVQVVAGLSNTANVYAIRRIETQVMVPSGNTLVLGGLINDALFNQQTKVPILGDIPLLGYAFRSSGKKREKKNLVIFITPSVVNDGDYTPTESKFLKTKLVTDEQLDTKADEMFKGALNSAEPHDWSKPVY